MSREAVKLALIVLLVVVLIGGEAAAWIHAFMTCSGHVVKNVFDWPVCVR